MIQLIRIFEKMSYPCESHLMPYKKTAKPPRTATTFNSIVNGHKLELSCTNTHRFCFFSLHRIIIIVSLLSASMALIHVLLW